MDGPECRDEAEGREGGGEFGDEVAGGLRCDGVDPHGPFDCPEAALTPVGDRHLEHAGVFDGVARLKVRGVLLEEGVEIVARFIFEEDDVLAAESVADGIEGGTVFACNALWPGGFGRVGS